MSKKTIWYLNHYAGVPNISHGFRGFIFAKNWVADGWKVLIFSASLHHVKLEKKHHLSDEIHDGVHFKFIETTQKYDYNGLKRLVNMMQFSIGLIRDKFNKSNDIPTVIIASSVHPFTLISGWWLARKYRAKFIVEIRDIWPLSIIELTGISKYHPLCITIKLIERFIYPKVDALVSLLPTSKEYFIQNGLQEDKFYYIPNGSEVKSKAPVLIENNISNQIREWQKEGFFCVIYTGAHGAPNALDYILEAMLDINNAPNQKIKLIFVGEGIEKTKLIEKTKTENICNIHFFDAVNATEIPVILNAADCGYIGCLDISIYKYGISANKIFEYMKAKLPIIHSINVRKDHITQADCGIRVAAEEPYKIANAIKEMHHIKSYSPERYFEMGQNGYNFLLEHHNYKTLSKKFEQLFE